MAKTEEKSPSVFSASQLVERSKSRDVVTACLSADIGFGGGIPLGCTVLFGGKAKSGKTTTVLQYAANAQQKYGSEVFYCNVEGRLDHKTLSQIQNLDLDKMHVVMGPAIEDKDGNVIGYRKMSSQEWWDKIGSLIAGHPRSIIIVDSVSALSEEAEMASGMGYMSRGGLQKLEAQFQRQYGDLIMPNGVTLFLLAQIQANTSGYGEPLQIKCGNAIKHLADAIVFIKGIEKWKPTANGRILGHDMVWKIEHSPLGPPLIDTKVPLRYGKGLDYVGDVVTNAMNWEVIKANGAWYILPFKKGDDKFTFTEIPETKEEQKGFVTVQGEENLNSWLKENTHAFSVVDEEVRKRVFF
jgi:recombination protein RecA